MTASSHGHKSVSIFVKRALKPPLVAKPSESQNKGISLLSDKHLPRSLRKSKSYKLSNKNASQKNAVTNKNNSNSERSQK